MKEGKLYIRTVRELILTVAMMFLWLGMSGQKHLYPGYTVTCLPGAPGGYYLMSVQKPNVTATNSASYNMILDSKGDVVYFKRFSAAQKTGDFKVQPDGRFSYFSKGRHYLLDGRFVIVDSVSCGDSLTPDSHELQVLPNGNYLILATENIVMDLSRYRWFKKKRLEGSTTATVQSGVILELDRHRNVVFRWRARDHFHFAEVDTFYLYDPEKVDWTHFNAVQKDTRGNYLLSVRNFNEVTLINGRNGSIVWRLGGKKNQFTFINDTLFIGQHQPRLVGPAAVLLYDNGRAVHPFHPASAKLYKLDTKKRTTNLDWEFTKSLEAHSSIGWGNVQSITSQHYLVNYGNSNSLPELFEVIGKSGKAVMTVCFSDSLRSFRVYHYTQVPITLARPVITSFVKDGVTWLDAGAGGGEYYWSDGSTGRMIQAKGRSSYFVWTALSDGGYIVSKPFMVQR